MAWDRDDVIDVIYAEAQRTPCGLSAHIIRILTNKDKDRINDLSDAIFRVYQEINWDLDLLRDLLNGRTSTLSRGLSTNVLRGELVCFFDPIEGFDFAVRVKLPENDFSENLHVSYKGSKCSMQPFNGLHWALVAPANGWVLGDHGLFDVEGTSEWKSLSVPNRQFWVLKQREESLGVFTADGSLIAGEEALLICAASIEPAVEDWGNLGQVDWDKKIRLNNEWFAFWKFTVLSEDIQVAKDGPAELHDLVTACKHSHVPAIIISGGLKEPTGIGWLLSAQPEISVTNINHSARLVVTSIQDNMPVWELNDVESGIKYPIEHQLDPGLYSLQIKQGQQTLARKSFKILKWDSLSAGECDISVAQGTWLLREPV